jgi:putative flippase GtrA
MSAPLVRYCLVGVVNTAVSLAVDAALLSAGVAVVVAAGAAFAAGAVCGYELNRRLTFRAARSLRAGVMYAAVATGGLLLEARLAVVAPWAVLPARPAYVAVLPVVTAATFLANRRLTFGATLVDPGDRERLRHGVGVVQ